MPRAILKDGQIRPLEPLPPDWKDGERLRVERFEEAKSADSDLDADFASLAEQCASGDPAEDARLTQALQEARQQAKTLVRQQMGLEP